MTTAAAFVGTISKFKLHEANEFLPFIDARMRYHDRMA